MSNTKKIVTVARANEMSHEDLLLALARESLRKYGTLTPPRETLLAVSRATCPLCGHEGKLLEDFGTRNVDGESRPQSWCRSCRNKASAEAKRNKPRRKQAARRSVSKR